MSLGERAWRGASGPTRNRPHGNLIALRVSVLVAFFILGLQLFRMQIIDGASYARRSEENHLTEQAILPNRGLIYDRNGEALVQNVAVYTAALNAEFLPESEDERYAIYLKLEQLLGVPALEIQTQVKATEENGTAYIDIPLKKYLTKAEALKLDEASADLPGVSLRITPGRQYIGGNEFSQILGYISPQTADDASRLEGLGYALNESLGRDGIEAQYEKDLRGTKGYVSAEQDAQGHLIQEFDSKAPIPGNGVQLAIDGGLQRYVSELLTDSLANPNDLADGDARNAAAVVMNAKTGEVYALVSVPNYDNNLFNQPDKNADAIDALLNDPDQRNRPLLNRALTDAAPGSTFKLVTAAAALQVGRITPSTGRDVTSTILLVKGENGEEYPLIDWRAHGYVDLYEAIAWSSNIYFFQASCGILGENRGLGKDSESSAVILGYYARALGYGKPTGIDLTGEFSGTIPDPAWKKRVHAGDGYDSQQWYYADTCFMGIGQGDVTATPLQVTRMTAAIANGGQLVTPHVGKAIVDGDGNVVRTIETQSTTVPVDPAYLADIREGMHRSVGHGAGISAQVAGLDIYGKTGTSQFIDYTDGNTYQHAWFTGFMPEGDTQIVVTVYFDRGVGGTKAAPIAGNILQYFANNVTP